MGDVYNLQQTLNDFANDVPNTFSHDEYQIANDLKATQENKDYKAMLNVLKKPIFGFLETEAVKAIKQVVSAQAKK